MPVLPPTWCSYVSLVPLLFQSEWYHRQGRPHWTAVQTQPHKKQHQVAPEVQPSLLTLNDECADFLCYFFLLSFFATTDFPCGACFIICLHSTPTPVPVHEIPRHGLPKRDISETHALSPWSASLQQRQKSEIFQCVICSLSPGHVAMQGPAQQFIKQMTHTHKIKMKKVLSHFLKLMN